MAKGEDVKSDGAVREYSPLHIPDECYRRVFQEDGDGSGIFDELATLFYDRPSYAPGDPPGTAEFKEGQR
ncbi:MAG: hypothetical protein AB9919_02240 [Geobacteraceae bacterium]